MHLLGEYLIDIAPCPTPLPPKRKYDLLSGTFEIIKENKKQNQFQKKKMLLKSAIILEPV